MRRIFLVFYGSVIIPLWLSAQCPERDLLWKRLGFLSESSSATQSAAQLREQLKELSGYEAQMRNCTYRYDSTHAFLLQRTGSVYFKQGETVKAIQVTRESIDMINSAASRPAANIRILIKNFYNLSVYYTALNRTGERMAAIDSCVTTAIREKYIDRISLYSLVQEVKYFFEIGDYERCIRYATIGESITAQYTGSDSLDYIINLLVLKVNSLINYKNYGLAEKLLSRKIYECEKIGALQHLGTIYELLAEVSLSYGDSRKALFYFQQALHFDTRAGFNKGCMQTLNNLGYIFYFQHFHDAEKALGTFRKALKCAGNPGLAGQPLRLEILNILTNIGKVYTYSGNFDSAFHYFQLAFDQVAPGIDENNFVNNFQSLISNKENIYFPGLVIDKGDAFFEQYKKTNDPRTVLEAIRVYKAADLLLGRIRSEQSEIQSKLFWRASSRRLYEHAIEACYVTGNINDAFYFLEKSRAVLLNDQLNEQRFLGEDNLLMVAQLKKKILSLQQRSEDTAISAADNTEIQEELFAGRQALTRLLKTIKKGNPSYYQNIIDTDFIPLSKARHELLREYQAMVELFSGDSAVYIISVTAGGSRFSKVNKAEFDSAVNLYISYISNRNLLNSQFNSFITTSRKLYRLLFRQDSLPSGRTVISPDGRYFPFEALITSKPGEALSYFLADHAISYSYSFRYLTSHSSPLRKQAAHSFLGIAPVDYPEAPGLASLYGSDVSLHNLETYFPDAYLLLSQKASRSNFFKQFYKYRIIQLYTHASDSGSTGEPVIYFSDSALHLSELIPANMPGTDLIVLSACETANGKVYMGEGVFSFSRGFAALGIPASVTNLWSVENHSTYVLTELFYKYLATGLPSDIALQKAKLEFIKTASKEKELPFFWAAPILAGKAARIDIEGKYPWKTIGIPALVVIACLSLWLLKLNANKTKRK